MPNHYQQELTKELNRLFALLQCSHGIYNVECRVCSNGKIYIMEVSPRGGGNHIAKLQDNAYGLNYIENEIRSALGLPLKLNNPKEIKGHWCSYSVHPHKNQSGRLKSITFNNEIKNRIQFTDLSYCPNQEISPFTGANMALGDVFFHCDTRDELSRCIALASECLIYR
jgi:biotin carboxylase